MARCRSTIHRTQLIGVMRLRFGARVSSGQVRPGGLDREMDQWDPTSVGTASGQARAELYRTDSGQFSSDHGRFRLKPKVRHNNFGLEFGFGDLTTTSLGGLNSIIQPVLISNHNSLWYTNALLVAALTICGDFGQQRPANVEPPLVRY